MTSQRYPEATVVETYCLSEWGLFMELSGQLHDGAAGMLDDVDINQDDTVYCNIEATECVNEITLTDEQVYQLEKIHYDKPSSISSNAIMRKQVTYIDHHR